MQKGILVIQSQPSDPSREDEYNRWYDEEHIHDILALSGFVSARRFRRVDTAVMAESTASRLGLASPEPDAYLKYLVICEVEAADLAEAYANLLSAVLAGALPVSEAQLMSPPPRSELFEELSHLTA